MNIFALDTDPQKAAAYHCDKHVVKMILESAQMISTVFDKYSVNHQYLLKPCFHNHPCTLWAGRTAENLHWLIGLGYFLTKEYQKRYKKVHVYSGFFHSVTRHQHYLLGCFPEEGLQPFAIAMPDYLKSQAKDGYDSYKAVELYRQYYILEKNSFAVWKHSQMPDWYRKHIVIKKKMILENSKNQIMTFKEWLKEHGYDKKDFEPWTKDGEIVSGKELSDKLNEYKLWI